MANKDILQYLRETPHNTNVNVVKGMMENGSGDGESEISYPKIFIQVTPGMGFDYQCLTHSYEDLIAFENDTLVWLDEEWTDGQTSNEFHGIMRLEKIDDVVFLLGLPFYNYDTGSTYSVLGKYYKITATEIFSAVYNFNIYK